ncbi:MAG: hypothetical protein KGJ86_00650 [Chloroflexota bacterium]|nr:hypothetical protein [Chloroflexota bacterium]
MTGLFRPLTIVRVRKTVVDFQVVESREEFRCMGSTQPLSSEDLVIKPEGERAWNWQRLHTTVDVDLGNDEIVLLRDTRYRVVGQSDYGAFGYVEYELVQDYGEECA